MSISAKRTPKETCLTPEANYITKLTKITWSYPAEFRGAKAIGFWI